MGSGEASCLQPERRVGDAGYVQHAFMLNLQLLSTNTLTETGLGTISSKCESRRDYPISKNISVTPADSQQLRQRQIRRPNRAHIGPP